MAGRRHLHAELGVDRVEQLALVGDQQAAGELVVLGLRDQVSGKVGRVGAESSARMPISVGPASASMPTTPLHQTLGRRDVDVAGPGHDVDRLDHSPFSGTAVGEHRDRLGAADRVDLVDAEQRARGQHGGVRQAAEVAVCGGDATASESTPATCAGTTFITTLDG